MNLKSMGKFFEMISVSRKKLKKNRALFWEENRKDFKKNIKEIIEAFPAPKKWKVYPVATSFILDKEIFPFDYDSWSTTDIIGASKEQGQEIMIFLNKARLEFLSLPAMIHLIAHEIAHTHQIADGPERYLKSIHNDKLANEMEKEADQKIAFLSDRFREQWILESIVYCYDLNGWSFAKKMADFLYKTMGGNLYGGGYEIKMNKKEYDIFTQAMKKKDINSFIDSFGK